jgi:hypothetical protein
MQYPNLKMVSESNLGSSYCDKNMVNSDPIKNFACTVEFSIVLF